MSDALAAIQALRRPRLLIRAARYGLADYRRDRTLARVLTTSEKTTEGVLKQLMRTEAEIEATRANGDVAYSVSRHLEVLNALMGEARLLVAKNRVPQSI